MIDKLLSDAYNAASHIAPCLKSLSCTESMSDDSCEAPQIKPSIMGAKTDAEQASDIYRNADIQTNRVVTASTEDCVTPETWRAHRNGLFPEKQPLLLGYRQQSTSSPSKIDRIKNMISVAGYWRSNLNGRDKALAASLAATRAGWERKREYYMKFSNSDLEETLFIWSFPENLAACWQAMSGKDAHAKAVHLKCMPRYHLVFLLTGLKSVFEYRCFGKQTMRELRWFFQSILGFEKPSIFAHPSPEENIVVIKNLIRQRLLLIHPDKYNEMHIENSQNKESLLECAGRLYVIVDMMRVLMNDENFQKSLASGIENDEIP